MKGQNPISNSGLSKSDLPFGAEAIQQFLVTKIARLVKLQPEELDASRTYSYYGLSSMESVLLVADLEDFLGRALDSTILWDYPTIESLAKFLANHE